MALPRNRRKAVANIFYAPDATSNGGDASRVGFSAASGRAALSLQQLSGAAANL